MLISFPPPPSGATSGFLTQVLDTIRRAFARVVSTDEGFTRFILLSPNGTAYNITITDAGVLTATLNDGKTRP